MNPSMSQQPSGALKRLVTTAALAVALAVAGAAAAQSLASLLPSDTLAAFGVQGLAKHQAKIQPFIDEWQRLDLTELLEQTSAEEGPTEEIPAELAGLTLFDILGDEVWIGVSVSSYNPLPAGTVVARLTDAGAQALSRRLAEADAESPGEQLTEGNLTFKVYGSEDEDFPIAIAQDGQFLAVSTNPDVLRGVLRRYQGAAEPSFTDSEAYANTLSSLFPAVFSMVVDVPHIVDVVEPFGQGLGFDQSAQRAARMLRTFGTFASVVRVTDAGLESLSLQRLGDRSLDPTLYDLLTAKAGYPTGVLSFVPAGAVGVQAGNANIPGWWAYLNELAADLQELGIGDLDTFLTENLGIDVQALLFGWMGPGTGAISVSAPAATEPGVMPESFLGDSVYLVQVTDEAAAEAGIGQFLTMAGSMASSFMDPSGQGGMVMPSTRESSGVTVTTYTFGEGLTFETAVTDGYLLVGTQAGSVDGALAAAAAGGGHLSSTLTPLQANVPAGAVSLSLSDDQASLMALADTVVSQLGLAAGLTGAEDLDFGAVEAAGQALTEFLHFVAGKFGGSYSYETVDGSVLRGYALSRVQW